MIKLPLLLLFLALSLALPVWTAWRSRGDALLVSIGQGLLIYLLSTVLSNFLSGMVGLKSLALAEDRQTYAVEMKDLSDLVCPPVTEDGLAWGFRELGLI